MSFFGANLKKARKQQGMTQRELAERIGAKHNSVSNWETGHNQPDTQMIRQICQVLSITANDLFGSAELGKEPMSREDLKFALFDADEPITDDMLQEVLDFAQFVKEKHRRRSNS